MMKMMKMMRSESTESHTTPNPNLKPKPDRRMTGSKLFTVLLMLVFRVGSAERVSGNVTRRIQNFSKSMHLRFKGFLSFTMMNISIIVKQRSEKSNS